MKEAILDNHEAPVKWWAANDARMRSIINSTHHSEATKLRAERMKYCLEFMYIAKKIYIAYGKKGVSIKVESPETRNTDRLDTLEAEWTEMGVTKRISSQGIIYRFSV